MTLERKIIQHYIQLTQLDDITLKLIFEKPVLEVINFKFYLIARPTFSPLFFFAKVSLVRLKIGLWNSK